MSVLETEDVPNRVATGVEEERDACRRVELGRHRAGTCCNSVVAVASDDGDCPVVGIHGEDLVSALRCDDKQLLERIPCRLSEQECARWTSDVFVPHVAVEGIIWSLSLNEADWRR